MIDNNVNSLLSENLPVFALDTCILLDVVQATDGIDSHRLSRQCKQDSGKTMRVVLFDQVLREFWNNLPRVAANSRSAYAASLPGTSDHTVWLQLKMESYASAFPGDPVAMLEQDANDMVAAACAIIADQEVCRRANVRINAGIRPARQINRSPGDCIILESLLSLADTLRTGGFQKDIVFVSRNYGEFSEGKLLRHLPYHGWSGAFQRLNILYLIDFPSIFNPATIAQAKKDQNIK